MSEFPVSLDNLIAYVKTLHPDGGPLDNVADAFAVSARLDDQSDAVIGYFVDQARRSGASWSQIGAAMGVTKQAAQKRFVPTRAADLMLGGKPFSRFTDRAKRVLGAAGGLAAEGAGVLGGGAGGGTSGVGASGSGTTGGTGGGATDGAGGGGATGGTGGGATGGAGGGGATGGTGGGGEPVVSAAHLAAALLSEPAGLAAKVIAAAGFTPEQVYTALGTGPAQSCANVDVAILLDLAFDESAKVVMRDALRWALRLGHNYIGTEHLLLAALFAGGPVTDAFGGLGLSPQRAEQLINDEIAAFQARRG